MNRMFRKAFFVARTRGLRALMRGVLKEVTGWILISVQKRRYAQTQVFDYRLWVDLLDLGISRTLWLYGERELDHKWIMDQVFWPNARVLDVGANIGYYAVMESLLVGDDGLVVAVEPSPENFSLLKKNIELNNRKNIVSRCSAVSNESGKREFWLARESNLNTFYKPILEKRGNLVGSIEVSVATVSDLTDEFGGFDFLRMDIEGHEVQVLANIVEMAKMGKKCPNIIFEAHINAYGPEQDIKPVLKGLERVGYKVAVVASSTENGSRILEGMGSTPVRRIVTDETVRTIHENLSFDELIGCLTETGGVRTIYLETPN
jgi:FkbM family methyltransferase